MKHALPILNHFTRGWLFLILVGMGCSNTTSQETASQIPPYLSKPPFYTGTLEVLQKPVAENMDRDIVLELDITYKKDSTGHWPETYYAQSPKVPINAVEVEWRPVAYYGDSLAGFDGNYPPRSSVVESIDSAIRIINWIRLPSNKDSVFQSYYITFAADEYKDLALEQEEGNLQLLIRIVFEGGNLFEDPSEEDLLYRFNYGSQELIWITPASGSVRHRSLGAKDDPALTIIE